jgi:hypothetical protein
MHHACCITVEFHEISCFRENIREIFSFAQNFLEIFAKRNFMKFRENKKIFA